MKVKEYIEHLSKLDPDLDVYIPDTIDGDETAFKTDDEFIVRPCVESDQIGGSPVAARALNGKNVTWETATGVILG